MPDIETEGFHRAVVALNGGPSDARIVRLVSTMAARTKAELIAVHVVEIDWTLPLDADIAGRSEEVQQILDSAEAIAESRKLTIETVLLQARDVAAAIVDEATERGADLPEAVRRGLRDRADDPVHPAERAVRRVGRTRADE
jgi:K+-sensing histidine kinase KdpD